MGCEMRRGRLFANGAIPAGLIVADAAVFRLGGGVSFAAVLGAAVVVTALSLTLAVALTGAFRIARECGVVRALLGLAGYGAMIAAGVAAGRMIAG